MDLSSAALDSALAQLRSSADLSSQRVAAVVEAAMAETYRRLVQDDPAVVAQIDLDRGTCRLVRRREDGSEEEVAVGHPDYPRQAAAAARHALSAALREAVGERAVREADRHRGELLDGVVEGRRGATWCLRVGDLQAVLPPEEQSEGEELTLGQHVRVVMLEGRRSGGDAFAVVSRSHPQVLHLLLHQEVPEVASGQVVVRGIVREAGRRSKVAVEAVDPAIDAQGACIGPRGVRHRALTAELRPEQVQVVTWSPDAATYVGHALAPAHVLGVTLDEQTRTARVRVEPAQVSLAIGRGGENARLAARLTGWRIDVETP